MKNICSVITPPLPPLILRGGRGSYAEGFTLIEIMVAVSILAIISVLVWQTSAVSMNAKERYETEDIRFQEARGALLHMADDISMAVLFLSKEHLGASGTGEARRETRFLGKDNGDQDELHFTSLSNIRYIKDSKECDQAEISYYLKKSGEDTGLWSLVKRVQSPPDLDPEKGGVEYPVIDEVKEFKLQFYSAARDEWQNAWNSSEVEYNKQLPRAVTITLTIPDPIDPEETRKFTTTSLLEMAPGPNDF